MALAKQWVDGILYSLAIVIARRQINLPFHYFKVEMRIKFVDVCNDFENTITLGSEFTRRCEEDFNGLHRAEWALVFVQLQSNGKMRYFQQRWGNG
ncbi:MAG: hypothetical protein IPM82_08260 [Saprospiraceae bacterium]|nr:hypothetical protein [Saprospiraceae bacterium]